MTSDPSGTDGDAAGRREGGRRRDAQKDARTGRGRRDAGRGAAGEGRGAGQFRDGRQSPDRQSRGGRARDDRSSGGDRWSGKDRSPRDDRRVRDDRRSRDGRSAGDDRRSRGGQPPRSPDPPLPDDIDPRIIDWEVREQLRPLARGVADQVAARLVAAGMLLDEDPESALAHALVARRLASRIPAVREAVGLAAYRAGEWQTAIAELRTYHRLTGQQSHLAVLADCERALGRPERAIDLYRSADRRQMSPAEAIELLIVAAGARSDLGQHDAAVAMLQVKELTSTEPWVARLRYAYANALLRVSRRAEARDWFARAAEADEYAETDAAERLLELDGVLLEDDADANDTDVDDTDVDDALGRDPFTSFGVKKGPLHDTGDPQ